MMRLLRLGGADRLRRGVALMLISVAVLVCGLVSSSTAQAAPRDNVANAKLCLHNGWRTLRTSTGGSFRNVGHCVIYALVGGKFGSAPAPPGE